VRTLIITAGCLLVAAAGCQNNGKEKPTPEDKIRILKQEKKELEGQIANSEVEKQQLKEQIKVLSNLPTDANGENLYDLQRIKLSRFTGFYDKDKDGSKEKLIVYFKPLDEDGDIVKATGSVDVRLEDWQGKELGKWRVEPGELKKNWFATILTINYRLIFDVAGKIDDIEKPATVKVTFTDYLTGKVFKELKPIDPP